MDQDKRQFRKLKRDIKRAGSKRRRRYLKRELTEQPEEAPFSEFEFGRDSSAGFNGMDQDATRRREPNEPRSTDYESDWQTGCARLGARRVSEGEAIPRLRVGLVCQPNANRSSPERQRRVKVSLPLHVQADQLILVARQQP